MAAYYSYLMRHAAADQLVKNAMLTSEDGIKFYFIHYDNDTINGLINIGDIDILPTDDRQSVDESGEYKFAGHGSVLWNMLEADEEFMEIVKAVDNALYSAGISYNECIRIFDEEQADKWVERVYNQDSEYKYVGPYVNQGINNLFMLQGKRDLHRRWWLSKRFSIYDAKFVSGEYKSQAVELKCMNDTPAGQQFTIKAGYPLDYGYGINNVPRQTGVTLNVGESHTFSTSEVVNLGDPIRIYGAPNIEEIDLSAMANRLAVVTINNVYSEALGTRLKKFILGGEGVNIVEVSEISGLKMAKKLTHLDVRGMRGIKSLDLTSQPYFEQLKATGSEVASVSFTKGAPVRRLELPATIKVLNLEQLPYLTAENLVFENIVGLHTINIKNCPNLANDFGWIKNWYDSKATADAKCTLVMDGVNWDGVNADDLLNIAKIGTLSLKGKVALTEITAEQITALTDAFGDNAFDKGADFYIDAPAAVFVTGRTTITEGESEQYNVVVFGAELQRVVWSIASGSNSYMTFDTETALLTTKEGYGSGTIVIKANIVTDKGVQSTEINVSVQALVYPTSSNTVITGNSPLEEEFEIFRLSYPQSVTGQVSAVWSLEGLDGYAVIDSQDNESCIVKKLQESALLVSGTITCAVTKKSGESLFTLTKTVDVINDAIAETDAGICKALYDAGLCANETYITKDEAAVITAENLNPGTSIFAAQTSNIKSFNGFKHFVKVTEVPKNCFYDCRELSSIKLPSGVTKLGDSCLSDCRALTSIELPSGLTSIGDRCFYNDTKLASIEIPSGVTSLPKLCFQQCSALASVKLPSALTSFGYSCFRTCRALTAIDLPSGIRSLSSSCFYSSGLISIKLPAAVRSIDTECFAFCDNLTSIELPSGLTSIGAKCFNGSLSLKTIISLASSAPTVNSATFGNSTSNYTGRNTYNTGENILYVPAGATGYDASYWLDPLRNAEKCGFSLSATL